MKIQREPRRRPRALSQVPGSWSRQPEAGLHCDQSHRCVMEERGTGDLGRQGRGADKLQETRG